MKLSFRKIAVTLFSIMFKGINLAFGQCPLITQQPASQFDCVPNSIVMTVTATGNNLTYQWQRSRPSDGGVFVNLPVDPGYQINPGTPNVLQIQPTGGVENPSRTRYRVIVSNGSCSVTSEPAEIKLNDISLSGFQATCAGSKFNLSVVFSEDDLNARSYQWEKLPNGQTDWIPVTDSYISGTNTHTLTFDNIPASEDRTKYRCKVFFNLSPNYDNPVDNCQKTTNEISLTVYPVPPVPIHSKETIIYACIGDKITLNSTGCSAEGGTTSWYDEANQLVASSAIYIFNASAPGAKNYKAICSKNGCSSPQSSGISVTVYAYPGAPKVTVSPVSGVVCQGNPVSLTATKENTGNTVRWYTQATGGSAVSTSNNSLLTAVRNVPSSEIVPIDANTPRVVNYWVDQSNGGGCRSSRSAISFTVNPGTLISSQPVDQKKCAGQDVVFSVIATGSGLSYQWKKGNVILTDGGKINGSKTANLTISTIDASDATNTDNLYSCSISGSCGAISSAFVNLSVSVIPDPPLIVSHISECESTGEESLNLHVNGLNLKWYSAQVQGNLLGTDLKIDRSLPAVQSYWVSQTNAEGCESARSQLDVLIDRKPEKPIILNTGSKSDFCNSEPSFTLKNTCKIGTSFFRTNEGTWEEKDESLINPPDFNTNASLRYDFKCVNKSQNNCESEVVTQVIQIKTAPIITQNLKDLEVCEGSDVSFSIIANAGGSPLNYLWKKGETSTNGTEADFKINKAGKSDEGEYRCIISANGCSVTSNIAKLTIVNNVQPQLEYAKEKCLGSEVLPISYEPKGGIFTVNSTEASVDSQTGKLTTSKGGIFQITYSINDNCGAGKSVSEIAILSVEAPIALGAKACLGSQVNLTASGCENGALLWFEENGASVSMPITFSKSVNYYAKCLKGECLSEKSNLVSIEETTTTHAQLEYAKEKCLGSEVLPISYEPKGGIFTVNSTEASVDSRTGKLETNQGGTFQITYSVNDNCGISKAISEIAIISVEAPMALGAKACLGSQVSLTASGCENGELLWFEENGTSVDMPIAFSKSVNYYAKCRKGECLSEKSNLVSIEETTTTHAQLEYAKEKCLGSEVLPISYEPKGGIFTVNSTEASVDSQTGKLTTSKGGIFEITYSVNDNCGISKAVSEIAIISVEAPTALGAKACLGSQVSLTASGCENGALLWFEENGASVDMPIAFSKSVNYYAKCRKGECLSEKSNLVSIEETTTTHAQLEYAKEKCLGSEVLPISYEPKGGIFTVNSTEASVDSRTGKLETNQGGTFQITYSVNDNCGISKAISEIAIISVEAPMALGAKACLGSQVSLTASGCENGELLWFEENGTSVDMPIAFSKSVNYYAKCRKGECLSEKSNLVSIEETTTTHAQLEYAKEKCLGSEVLPISYEPKGGIFTVNSTEASVDSQTGKLTTSKGGIFEITYSVNDNCGISKAVSEIAIISVEAPTALGAKACLGSQVSLTASGCENGELLWFEENGASVSMPITFSKSVNYYAKCRKGECLSEKSNLVSIEETTTTHAQLEYAKEKCLGSEVLPISYEPKGGIFTVNSTEASVDSQTGKLTTNKGGIFEITYSVNDNCGISKAVSEIAIISVEAPTALGAKACLGSQVSLIASGCENGELLWFEENGASVSMPIAFSKSANYYAKCRKGECLSEKSNLVSIEETTTTHAQLEYAKEACIGATIFPQSFEPVGGTFVLISGNASVDPQTGKLEPLNSGVFTVEYVLNGDCGGDKASTNILVNPLPVANAGAGGTLSPSQVYDLASVQTASGGTAPYSFEWTASPNVTISPNAQSSNPKFTGFTTPDLIKLKIIDSKGCQASATASIGVRNCDLQVQILSKGSLCGNSGNNEVILSPSVTSGIAPFSYKWLKNQNIISQNQTLSVNDPGEYILEVEDAAGCQGKSGITVSRSTLSKPVVASETVKGSGSVTLVATNCNGSGVNWYDVNLQFLINSFTYRTQEITSPAKYYAQCVGDGCLSELTEVNVFFIPAPQAPLVKSAIVCGSGNMASLSASSCAGEINWYWAIKDEKPFSKDFSIMVGPITMSSDVYVECIVNGVPSPRVRGFITLKDLPDNRTEVLGNTEICEGSFAVIRASGSAEIKAYQWKKEGRITDGNQREFIARESGNYSVIVSSDGCTAESPQVRINVVQKPASPSIFAEGKSTVCEGNSVNIKAVVPSDSRENRWYKDGRLISYYENIATGESGRYELIVVNYLGCTSNASNPVFVNILPKPAAPQIIINGNDKFCSDGVSPELTTNFAYGYEWNSKNGLKSQSRSIKAGNKSDWFSLTIKDGNGCISHESSKEIIVFPLPHKPEINSIGKPEICVGEKLTIRTDSLPEITYLWSDHGKNHFENVISGQKSGFESISLSIKDLNNCISPVSENLIVKINPLPSKPIISANHSLDLCDGEAMKLYSAEAFKYHWNTGDTIRAIIVEKAGKYSLFTENVFGCKSEVSDSVSVIVRGKPQKPKVTVRGDLNFCEDGRKTILLSSPGLYYKWNTGDSAQAISVGTSGKYVLSIGNEYNCWSVLSDTIKIITYPLPGRPVISVMGDKTFCADSKTILSSTEEQEYLWNNGNTSRKIVVNKSGNYSLIVTNKFGCRSLKSEDIQIEVKTLPLSPALSVIGVYNLEAKSAEEGNGYEWKFEDRLLEDTSSVVKVVETGIYTARKKKAYMLSENNMLTCYSFPSVIKYVNKYASEREWFIYPNPNPGDKVIIETPDNLENVRILIYDFHGKLHLDGFVEKLDRRYALLINELTTGQYILKLISPEFEAAKLFYVIK